MFCLNGGKVAQQSFPACHIESSSGQHSPVHLVEGHAEVIAQIDREKT
jgi:hypothetical protein